MDYGTKSSLQLRIVKKKTGQFKVLLAGMAWRTFGTNEAAKTLLEAMDSDDEQERMLAGMSLVKAGDRSIDLIQKTLASNQATPPIIRLLADIGGPKARSMLNEIASGEPGELTEVAEQCLDLLSRIEALPPEKNQ